MSETAATAPGRAAYETWRRIYRSDAPWEDIGEQEREAWAAVERDASEAALRAAKCVHGDLAEERDNAYRERAALVAYLSAVYPAALKAAPDADGWFIVYVHTPSGQMSWHIAPEDADLFRHLPPTADCAPWDGHTTDEKYARLAELTKRAASGASA